MTRLLIVGAGGHGKVVADAAREAGLEVVAFADREPATSLLLGTPIVRAATNEVPELAGSMQASVVVALGDNGVRRRVEKELVDRGVTLTTVVHPSAVIASSARIGAGAMILAGAIVGVEAHVGRAAIINTGARVDHDNSIGDYAHLSPGVALGGEVNIGEGAHLAIGVSVRNRVTVGAWTTVGVGAAVVCDLPANCVAVGVPARVVRSKP